MNKMKIISVSLWGQNPRYCEGALINAKIAKELFPDWQYRVYTGSSVPVECNKKLKDMNNVKVYDVDEMLRVFGAFWRFNAIFENNIVILRDTDSRLLEREKKCIEEWIVSDKQFSIIRDHPRHFDFPILAGMWGVKGKINSNLKDTMKGYENNFQYGSDQYWLAHHIWPIAKENCMIHEIGNDSWFSKQRKKEDPVFVGQGYDENDTPLYPSWG